MAIKHIVDTTDIRKQIEDFTKETATPSVYCKDNMKDTPEQKLQKHLSEYLSDEHDVLREISIPALESLPGSGVTRWEIDETLLIPTNIMGSFYATGELKFHGKDMADTQGYVKDVKEDIRRMKDVARLYSEVTMAFALFITYDEKERDEVYAYANQLESAVTAKKVSLKEKGYYSVLVTIAPSAGQAAYSFTQHWRERLEYLRATNKTQNNYFPRKRKQF